jgi:hypothetical protein
MLEGVAADGVAERIEHRPVEVFEQLGKDEPRHQPSQVTASRVSMLREQPEDQR